MHTGALVGPRHDHSGSALPWTQERGGQSECRPEDPAPTEAVASQIGLVLRPALEDHEVVVRKGDDVRSTLVDAAHTEMSLDNGPVLIGAAHEGSPLQLSELPVKE